MAVSARSNNNRPAPSAALYLLVLAIALSVSAPNSAQRKQSTPPPPPPPAQPKLVGGIVVLPGYTFTEEHGIDSRGGRLAKTGGPNIGFEIGAQRASIANNVRPQEILWSKTADIRGTTARIYMTRGAFLLVDNGYANFVARNVRTPEDVADVLVTALSYDPDQSRRTPAVKK